MKITQKLVKAVRGHLNQRTHTITVWALFNSEEYNAITFALYAYPDGTLAELVNEAKSVMKLGV
jgi:hypothetical protein